VYSFSEDQTSEAMEIMIKEIENIVPESAKSAEKSINRRQESSTSIEYKLDSVKFDFYVKARDILDKGVFDHHWNLPVLTTKKEVKTVTSNKQDTKEEIITKIIGIKNLKGQIKLSFNIPMEPSLSNDVSEEDSDGSIYQGILTRPITHNELNIKFINPENSEDILVSKEFVEMINTHIDIAIPVRRSALTHRRTIVTLQDGIVKDYKVDKESSIKEAVAIPINLAKAVVSIPSEIFQFKYNKLTHQVNIEQMQDSLDAILNPKAQTELQKLTNEYELKEKEYDLLSKEAEIEKLLNPKPKSDLEQKVEDLTNKLNDLEMEKKVDELGEKIQQFEEEN